jgi:hypothetical protein
MKSANNIVSFTFVPRFIVITNQAELSILLEGDRYLIDQVLDCLETKCPGIVVEELSLGTVIKCSIQQVYFSVLLALL